MCACYSRKKQPTVSRQKSGLANLGSDQISGPGHWQGDEMTKHVLLVGLEYSGEPNPDVFVETRGLCYSTSFQEKAAAPLYNYDVIIIYPKSYSHFVFGHATAHSNSRTELWSLKSEDNSKDLDNAFGWHERQDELEAAISQGTRVIWIATQDKTTHFFGNRSLYLGYCSRLAERVLAATSLSAKTSTRLTITPHAGAFTKYYEQLGKDGWNLCWKPWPVGEVEQMSLALTPDGCSLGVQVQTSKGVVWLVTPPTSPEALNTLIQCSLHVDENDVRPNRFFGIFLSHSHEDKPFVRRLAASLHERGVEEVWVDEAEIEIGDSLIRKIQDGIIKSEYFGIVLSPHSITSEWVQRELEQAMSMEIQSKNVKVLPLLYEKCDLPGFLQGKLYADFTSETVYESSLQKLLRRLERRS